MTPARFGRRYIAFLLDIFFLEILGIFATVPLINQMDQDLTEVLIRWFAMGKISPEGVWLVALYCLVWGLLWSMYFVGFTAVCGQTPGKRIMGLYVVNENGAPVDWMPHRSDFSSVIPFRFCHWAWDFIGLWWIRIIKRGTIKLPGLW